MAARRSGLRREVGLFQLVTYGVGNIIGAGIYVLVGGAAGLAGGAVWLAFLIAAGIALFTGLSYSELASMYPKAASEYVYVGKAYGNRMLSFLAEWIMLITEVVAAAAVALGFAGYFQSLFVFPVPILAAFLLIALTIVVIIGIKESIGLNTVLSLIAVLGLVVVIIAGVTKIGSVHVNYVAPPFGISGVFGAIILVFFAYIGFDNISNLSEETKNPQKTIPRGLLISLAISTVFYIAVSLAAVNLVPWQQLAGSSAPLALAVSKAFGANAYFALTVAGLVTTLNTTLVLLIVGSRIIYGMASEGALPRFLGRVGRRGTPYVASVAALLVSLAFVSLGNVDSVARITSFGSLIVFAMVNISLLHLRRAVPRMKRPFKAPFNVGWISVTALLGVVSCLALLTQFGLESVLLGLAFPLSGFAAYFLINRNLDMEVDSGLHQKHE